MNIAFFTDSYHPYISGVVRSIETFSRELEALGHEVTIFAPRYPHAPEEQGVMRFISLRAPRAPGFRLAIPISPRLRRRMRELKLDIIHSHSPFLMGHLALFAARTMGLPLVFTYHTKYEDYAHYLPLWGKVSRRMAIEVPRYYCQHCQLVISPSVYLRYILKKRGIRTPLKVIPTGVDPGGDTPADSPATRRSYNLRIDDTVLLYVGRISREKNVFFLLKALRELLVEHPDYRLVLVGGGAAERECRERITAWGLEDQVTLTGAVDHGRVLSLYAAADLFLFPSTTETQGIVLLEAMIAGLPVIGVRDPIIAQFVRHQKEGLLTPVEPGSFREAVSALAGDPARRKVMGQAARCRGGQYSARRMAQKLLASYREHT